MSPSRTAPEPELSGQAAAGPLGARGAGWQWALLLARLGLEANPNPLDAKPSGRLFSPVGPGLAPRTREFGSHRARSLARQ